MVELHSKISHKETCKRYITITTFVHFYFFRLSLTFPLIYMTVSVFVVSSYDPAPPIPAIYVSIPNMAELKKKKDI